eukprot:6971562-Prymnesium_polylepis.1
MQVGFNEGTVAEVQGSGFGMTGAMLPRVYVLSGLDAHENSSLTVHLSVLDGYEWSASTIHAAEGIGVG